MDVSIEAIQKAIACVDALPVRVNIRWTNIVGLRTELGAPYDFIFDRGYYEYVCNHDAEGYAMKLRPVMRPGSQLVFLAGRCEEVVPQRIADREIWSAGHFLERDARRVEITVLLRLEKSFSLFTGVTIVRGQADSRAR